MTDIDPRLWKHRDMPLAEKRELTAQLAQHVYDFVNPDCKICTTTGADHFHCANCNGGPTLSTGHLDANGEWACPK